MKRKNLIVISILVLAISGFGLFTYKVHSQLFSNPFNRSFVYENPSYSVIDNSGEQLRN